MGLNSALEKLCQKDFIFYYCLIIKLIRLVFLEKKINKEQPFGFAICS